MNRFQTQKFIQQRFSEYYKQNSDSVQPPTSAEKREFAFLRFEEKSMLRHKGFEGVEAFRNLLCRIAPSDVYYSCAYYESPEEEMSAKGWLGADLIFDIDADHIPTPCNKQHDVWTCRGCGRSGHGAKPEQCPQCGGQKFNAVSWPCDICLESARRETMKLTEALEEDFGFSQQELTVAFSGHRGYHVHVENEIVRSLDSMGRKEIVDYLGGIGVNPSLHGVDLNRCIGPNLEDVGWKGRIAKGTYELFASPIELDKAGLKLSAVISGQEKQIQERWNRRGPWGLVAGVGKEKWEKLIQLAIERQSVKIDTVVTVDIHRLIRLANTLHGETGLKKVEVGANEIERFDPFRSAVAFEGGNIIVEVSDAPQFRFGDSPYGPFSNQVVELPTAAAMFLLCKGVAKVAEEELSVQ